MARKIKIDEILYEKIPISGDNKFLIRDFERIHFYDGCYLEIFFDPTDKFYFLVYIGVEIDSRAFESDGLSFLGLDGMSIGREVIVCSDLTGKCKRSSQGIHAFLRSLAEFSSDSGDKLDQKICPYTEKNESEDGFRI